MPHWYLCQYQQQYHHQHIEYKKKDPEDIPILRYGPNNNFAKFKEAMPKATLKNYEIWVISSSYKDDSINCHALIAMIMMSLMIPQV